jgi:acetyl esterase/lipase
MLGILRTFVLFQIIFVLFAFQGCNSAPSCKVRCIPKKSLFSNWFLNPTEQKLSSLILSGLKPDQIDTLVKEIRKDSKTGAFVDTLTDSTGTDFLIGGQTPPFRPDSLYPLIIYLHGGTGTELNSKGDSAYKMLSFLGDSLPIFFVSPSANRYAPWWSPVGLSRILQTLRYMALHYPIDPKKVFLTGVSDGATGCWAAANSANSPFAGFIAISGFGGMLSSLGLPLYPVNIMQRPIYNINAGNDRLYPIDQVNNFLDYMEKSGVNVKRKVYPDEQHGFDYRLKEFSTLLEIIRTWSKPAYKGIAWTFVPGVQNVADNIIDYKLDGQSDASISAVYRNDTLIINSNGITNLTVCSDNHELNVEIHKNEIRKYSAQKPDKKSQYLLMLHDCFPHLHQFVYSINIERK